MVDESKTTKTHRYGYGQRVIVMDETSPETWGLEAVVVQYFGSADKPEYDLVMCDSGARFCVGEKKLMPKVEQPSKIEYEAKEPPYDMQFAHSLAQTNVLACRRAVQARIQELQDLHDGLHVNEQDRHGVPAVVGLFSVVVFADGRMNWDKHGVGDPKKVKELVGGVMDKEIERMEAAK